MDLFYTHVAGNTYKITCVAYGDCGPSSAAAFSTLPTSSPTICIYNGATFVTSISLTIQPPTAGLEITPVCNGTITQCTNITSPIPGIKKFVYTGNYTVPTTSHYWRFQFTGDMGAGSAAGRAAAITNIAGGTTTQLVDTLDNTYHDNSNPVLTVVPVPFFCLNNNDSYTPGAVDPDGDVLGFHLVAGMNGSTTCTPGTPVTYLGAFTASNPLGVAPGTFAIDTTNGQITFFPNILQRALVVYNVREYRSDTFIGSCQREMTFLVQTCINPPPIGGIVGSTTGTVLDSTHFEICDGTGPFSITINPTESDTSNLIKVHPGALPGGSTVSVVNDSTNHPVVTFTWTTVGLTPGTYVFFINYTDNNCPLPGSQTIAYNIVILPKPTIGATGGGTFCQGTPATLTGTGGSSYTWSPGTGLSCTSCTSPLATPPVGTIIYTVTGVDTNGCSNTDTVGVTVMPIPTVTATPDTTICKYSSLLITATGATTYSWAPGGSLSCVPCVSPTASPLTTTTYTVTGTGAGGCSNTATVTISVDAPTVTMSPGATICAGGNTTLSAGGSGVSYVWTPPAGLSCTSCTSPIASPTVTTTYTVTATDGMGCWDWDTATVIYVSAIHVTAPTTTICLGNPATVTATGAVSYIWSPATGLSCTACSNPSANPAATTVYTIIGTTSVCHDTDTVSVIVNPLPVITATGDTTKCQGDPASMLAYGGVSYSWSPVTGLSCTTCFDPIATPPSTTTYVATGYNIFGCSSSASVTITIQPLPIITVSPPVNVCQGSGTALTAGGGLSYVWTPTTGMTPDTGASVYVIPPYTITYTVTGTGPNACIGSASTTITVVPIPPAPDVVSPVSYCKDAPSVQLSATGSNLLWYTDTTGTPGVVTVPVPTTSTVGIFIWYVSQTVNGCESPKAPIVVNVFDNAITAFNYDIHYGCYVDTVVFTNNSQFVTRCAWSFGDGTTDTAFNPVHLYTVVKDTTFYPIELIGYNPACYADSTLDTLPLAPTPRKRMLYDVTPDAVIAYGSSIQLNSDGAYIYMWVPDDGSLNNANINNPVATPEHDTTYIVYGYDINGCMDSARVHVSLVYDEESVPDAFTPNGDGLNDLFRVHNLKYGKIVEFSIYNRWGQQIFHARDNHGWDGTFQGVPQDMGVYDYMIIVSHADGKTKMWKGDVTLVR